MKIKKVSCEQFAGISDRDVRFEDGLNLMISENETGKSTLADLIYHLFFSEAMLSGKDGEAFMKKYYPKAAKGPDGDYAEAEISFETEEGAYKLTKKWGKKTGYCRLRLPNGTSVEDQKTVKDAISDALKYQAGVYGEIVFPSQKRDQVAVESIMKAVDQLDKAGRERLKDTKDQLLSTLTKATLETGGVSIDRIETYLTEHMSKLDGKWDFTAGTPEGGASRRSLANRWKNGAGEIVNAYYEGVRVREEQKAAEDAERAVETADGKLREAKRLKEEAAALQKRFMEFSSALEQKNNLEQLIQNDKAEMEKAEKAGDDWPKQERNLKAATELREQKRQAALRDHWTKVEEAMEASDKAAAALEESQPVEQETVNQLNRLIRNNAQEEAKLAGLNLTAQVKQLGTVPVELRSAASGEVLEADDGEYRITEAVDITVPDVVEIRLMPRGVDVDQVQKNLDTCREEIRKIYDRYQVNSPEELQNKVKEYDSLKSEVKSCSQKLEAALSGQDYEELKKEAEGISGDLEATEEIDGKIKALCGNTNLDGFIGSTGNKVSGYEDQYKSPDEIAKKIEELSKRITDREEELGRLGDIPEEFVGKDPRSYRLELEDRVKEYDDRLEQINEERNSAIQNLGEKSAEEYAEDLQRAEEELQAKIREYEHWKNIFDKFTKLKKSMNGNPAQEIEGKFREYLSVITDGSLRLTEADEKLTVKMESGDHALGYEHLSDGTKNTISLAFRLAMLEYLFPEGGGLAVFDDPFTDMDPKRLAQACALVKRFAEKNQVIFLTCDGKYEKLLQGKRISLA